MPDKTCVFGFCILLIGKVLDDLWEKCAVSLNVSSET